MAWVIEVKIDEDIVSHYMIPEGMTSSNGPIFVPEITKAFQCGRKDDAENLMQQLSLFDGFRAVRYPLHSYCDISQNVAFKEKVKNAKSQ